MTKSKRLRNFCASVCRRVWGGSVQKGLGSLALFGLVSSTAWANPVDPSVGYGQVTVTGGSDMRVVQSSDRAIVNWRSFSVGRGETVRFEQPGAQSVILNRVVGSDPSEIWGALQANGRVFLVNPNGILISPEASLSVGSLVTSTLPISDQEFLHQTSGSSLLSLGQATGKRRVLAAVPINTSQGTRNAVDFDGRNLVYFALPPGSPGGLLLATPGGASSVLAQTLGVSSSAQADSLVRSADGSLRLVRAQTTNPTTVTVQVTLTPLVRFEETVQPTEEPPPTAFAQDNAFLVEELLPGLEEVSDVLEEPDDPADTGLNWWDSDDFMRHKIRR